MNFNRQFVLSKLKRLNKMFTIKKRLNKMFTIKKTSETASNITVGRYQSFILPNWNVKTCFLNILNEDT